MISLVALVSCNKSSSPTGPSNANGVYWPLAMGNKWQYIAHETDSLGNIKGNDIALTYEVVATNTVGGKNAWQLMMTSQESGSKPDTMRGGYLAYADNGDLLAYDEQAAVWNVVLPISSIGTGVPFSKRDTTVSINMSGSDQNITYDTSRQCFDKVFAVPTQQIVTVAAGEFQTEDFVETDTTINLHHSSTGYADTSVYGGRTHMFGAANVGIVKIVDEPRWSRYFGTASKSGGTIQELVTYTVR